MLNNKIKDLTAIDLDFENIRSSVRNNIDTSIEARQKLRRKMPYMRAIRAVCIALCICTAAAALAVIINQTNFFSNMVTPPTPGGTVGGTEETEQPAKVVSPGKAQYGAEKFDKFFTFGSVINAEMLLNSDILSEEDKAILKNRVDELGYNPWVNGSAFCVYMGTRDGIDVLELYSWPQDTPVLIFNSNLDYGFEDIINEFEQASGTILTDEYLTQASSSSYGIELNFKRHGDKYLPYYEAKINNKMYLVNQPNESFDKDNASSMVQTGDELDSLFLSGKRAELDVERAKSFDKFIAFGKVADSSGFLRMVERTGMIGKNDINELKNMPDEYDNSAFGLYFGIRDGEDIVEIVSLSHQGVEYSFKSYLNYSFEDIINSFETASGETLTDEFLISPDFDNYLWKEMNGIEICFKYYKESEEYQTIVDGYRVYFKTEINGKMYVSDFETNNPYDATKDKAFAETFDRFFAYSEYLVTGQSILESNILSDKDKAIFKEYDENAVISLYEIYMGVIDGMDKIVIRHTAKSDNVFYFSSPFDYSFESVIDEFEQRLEREITDEFLVDGEYYNASESASETSPNGIYLSLSLGETFCFIKTGRLFHSITLNDKEFTYNTFTISYKPID